MKTFLFIACCLSSAYALITEIPLPSDVHMCFERELTNSNVTNEIGEVIFSRCVHKMLWLKQTSMLEKQPIGKDAEKWISGLVDMSDIKDFISGNSHRDPHRLRPRRQASRTDQARIFNAERGQTGRRQQTLRRQPRVRKEYRMLTERERALFHRAINMLKADTVSKISILFVLSMSSSMLYMTKR